MFMLESVIAMHETEPEERRLLHRGVQNGGRINQTEGQASQALRGNRRLLRARRQRPRGRRAAD